MRAFDDFDGEINRLKTLGRLRLIDTATPKGFIYTPTMVKDCATLAVTII